MTCMVPTFLIRRAQAAGATKLHYEIAEASQGVHRRPPPFQLIERYGPDRTTGKLPQAG
jgi:hypothetical protein